MDNGEAGVWVWCGRQASKREKQEAVNNAAVRCTTVVITSFNGHRRSYEECRQGARLPLVDHHHTTTVLRPFFWDHPGEPVPEENFWTLCASDSVCLLTLHALQMFVLLLLLWCKERLTEADTPTIRLGATPSGLTIPVVDLPCITALPVPIGRYPFPSH